MYCGTTVVSGIRPIVWSPARWHCGGSFFIVKATIIVKTAGERQGVEKFLQDTEQFPIVAKGNGFVIVSVIYLTARDTVFK